jgi:hypothetical protein
LRLVGALSCLFALAACNQEPIPQANGDAEGRVPTADVQNDAGDNAGAAVASEALNANLPKSEPDDRDGQSGSQSKKRSCYLEVDGVIHVDGPCLVFPMGGDQYTLNTWDDGKPAQSHFAIVSRDTDDRTTATWNKDPDDTRAFDPLGVVRKVDGCWVNERARICAR